MVETSPKVIGGFALFTLILVGVLFIGQAIAADSQPREQECREGPDETFVEELISDGDCTPETQADLIGHVENKDMPKFSIEDETLDYGEYTTVEVEVWHTDPNVNYNCQMRTINDGVRNGWTDFVEVSREEAGPPSELTQTIRAPTQEVSAQTDQTVAVEVYCYGPASNEPYGVVFSDWIAQGFWTETLTYTYPSTLSIEEQQETLTQSVETEQKPTQSEESQLTDQQETQSAVQEDQNSVSDTVPDDDEVQRGFFTNDPDSGVEVLQNPFNITMIGFLLSIGGIVLQLRRGV